MNLLRFAVVAGEGGPFLAGPSLRQPLPPPLARRLPAAGTGNGRHEVVLGVRPEDLRLSRQSVDGSLPAEVFVVEDLGNERLVTVRLDGQLAVARAAADFPAEMGETLWLSYDPTRAHLFDPATEQRLG
jgi:multiple sugar transport system ATP-binding protein